MSVDGMNEWLLKLIENKCENDFAFHFCWMILKCVVECTWDSQTVFQ